MVLEAGASQRSVCGCVDGGRSVSGRWERVQLYLGTYMGEGWGCSPFSWRCLLWAPQGTYLIIMCIARKQLGYYISSVQP